MPTPFEYVNSFNKTKKSLIESEEMFQKEYAPFIVNRAIANNAATVLFADVMNESHFLDKKIQHDWYLYAIPKNNQYTKYVKKDKTINTSESILDFVKEDLSLSEASALEVISLLGETFIQSLLEKRGGATKWNNKNKNQSSSSE